MTRASTGSRRPAACGAALLLVLLGISGCDNLDLPNSPGRGVPRQDGPLSVPPGELKTSPAPP